MPRFNDSRHDAVGSDLWCQFTRQGTGEDLQGSFRGRVGTRPAGTSGLDREGEVVDDAAVSPGIAQRGDGSASHQECRMDIDLKGLQPQVGRAVFEGGSGQRVTGVIKQHIESSRLCYEIIDDSVGIRFER